MSDYRAFVEVDMEARRVPSLRLVQATAEEGVYRVVLGADGGREQAAAFAIIDTPAGPGAKPDWDIFMGWPGDASSIHDVTGAVVAFHKASGSARAAEDSDRRCLRCGRPVVVNAMDFEPSLDRMHFVCFHYEYEHDPADPDEQCGAGNCPSAAVTAGAGERPDDSQSGQG